MKWRLNLRTEIEATEIWVVDRLDYWRAFAAGTLEHAGFVVEAYGHYEELAGGGEKEQRHPDLVLLGCTRSRVEERRLIEELVRQGSPVLILSSSLSCDDFRSLFLAGAIDVSPRPNSPDLLLSLVRSDLADLIQKRQQPRAWFEASL
jgi:DNA-binding NtrC family response regulator